MIKWDKDTCSTILAEFLRVAMPDCDPPDIERDMIASMMTKMLRAADEAGAGKEHLLMALQALKMAVMSLDTTQQSP